MQLGLIYSLVINQLSSVDDAWSCFIRKNISAKIQEFNYWLRKDVGLKWEIGKECCQHDSYQSPFHRSDCSCSCVRLKASDSACLCIPNLSDSNLAWYYCVTLVLYTALLVIYNPLHSTSRIQVLPLTAYSVSTSRLLFSIDSLYPNTILCNTCKGIPTDNNWNSKDSSLPETLDSV